MQRPPKVPYSLVNITDIKKKYDAKLSLSLDASKKLVETIIPENHAEEFLKTNPVKGIPEA